MASRTTNAIVLGLMIMLTSCSDDEDTSQEDRIQGASASPRIGGPFTHWIPALQPPIRLDAHYDSVDGPTWVYEGAYIEFLGIECLDLKVYRDGYAAESSVYKVVLGVGSTPATCEVLQNKSDQLFGSAATRKWVERRNVPDGTGLEVKYLYYAGGGYAVLDSHDITMYSEAFIRAGREKLPGSWPQFNAEVEGADAE